MEWQNGMIKPPYRVPSMSEIRELPWNGYNVMSTFSGMGGSSLGYKMAGYKVLWANEFITEAQNTYRLNHPTTVLDPRDIRKIDPMEALASVGLKPGELDLFDGSPPCSAFSTAGKREKGWGTVKKYSDSEQRVDDLFFEYVRFVRIIQPKTFVAENVSGLVKGTAKGYFKLILSALKDCGYRVEARLLNGKWLGVPQARQRIIFIGVRNDLGLKPVHPEPLPYYYTIRDAISDLRGAYVDPESWADKGADTPTGEYSIASKWRECKPGTNHPIRFQVRRSHWDEASHTLTTTGFAPGAASVMHPDECRKFSIAEGKRLSGVPDDFELTGGYKEKGERLGRLVPPVMMKNIAKAVQVGVLDKLPRE